MERAPIHCLNVWVKIHRTMINLGNCAGSVNRVVRLRNYFQQSGRQFRCRTYLSSDTDMPFFQPHISAADSESLLETTPLPPFSLSNFCLLRDTSFTTFARKKQHKRWICSSTAGVNVVRRASFRRLAYRSSCSVCTKASSGRRAFSNEPTLLHGWWVSLWARS